MSRGSVRQGGRRSSGFDPEDVLLRIRSEKGERAARQLLTNAGIDPSTVENETGWLSVGAAKRALGAIAELLGGTDALRKRGEWTSNPEALGTLVRMLRVAERPIDAYRYLASNAREVTRIGTGSSKSRTRRTADPSRARAKKPVEALSVKMTYRLRDDADESVDRNARRGRRSSAPRARGSSRASDDLGLARRDGRPRDVHREGGRRLRVCRRVEGSSSDRTDRGSSGSGRRARRGDRQGRRAARGVIAGLFGGALGGGAGYLWDRAREDKATRSFERNRIAALERGLELRGDLGATPASSRGRCSAESTASGARSVGRNRRRVRRGGTSRSGMRSP